MDQVDLIWKNGEFVPWEDAQTHVLSHGLHYGTGVFEGIRCYETERGPAIFRHPDHLDRLEKSAELYYLELPYSAEEIRQATHELLRRNGLAPPTSGRSPTAATAASGSTPRTRPIDVIVAAFPWGAYLGEESKNGGIRAKVSSWRRISPGGSIPHAKASGSYLNSILAKTESAQRRLRRGDPARRARLRLRGLGREHLRGPRRRDRDAAARRLDPRRDQPQVGDPDRPRPRLHRGRARHRPRRAVPGRGGLPDRDRRRAGAGARDRRPPARRGQAGRDHHPRPGQIRGRPLRACRGVPGVARLRRGAGRG